MFGFFVLAIFALIVYTQQQIRDPVFMETFQKNLTECSKEENFDAAIADKAIKENHFPSDRAFKCFVKCVQVKLGALDNTGEVVDDVLKTVSAQFVDDATDREIVAECGAIRGADLCETAFNLMVCIQNATLD